MAGLLIVRQRSATRILKNLDVNSGTGPDETSSRLLKKCALALSKPVALLTRLNLSSGRWPRAWREHWIVPIYKRKAKHDPDNYRGVHLTAQLSKCVERLLGQL